MTTYAGTDQATDDPWDGEVPPMPDPPEDATSDLQKRFPSLDWHEAFATDFTKVDWLAGRFMEKGQQVAIVGDGKVGKSLFAHDWLWRAVTGRSFLGDERRDRLRVLYFDRENSLRDIVTRMIAFGANPDDLAGWFDYRMFPKFTGGLDSVPTAVAELFAIVDEQPPDVVVFDTVSRFITGKENDSDTWLQFYSRVHAPLKARGIAGTRLDHMGKDLDRGSRGSSAKAQDVDHVWEMSKADERHEHADGIETVITQIRMKRTYTRTGIGDDILDITRRGRKAASGLWVPGETRHELTAPSEVRQQAQVIQTYVDELIMRGVPHGIGRGKIKDWAVANKINLPGNATVLAQVVAGVKAAQRENE